MSPILGLIIQIAGITGWIATIVGVIWYSSRRTQGWDRGNQAWLILHGDKDSKNPSEKVGLLDLIEDHIKDNNNAREHHPELRNLITEALERARGIQEGFGAFGSKTDQIAKGVRKSVEDMVREAEEARANRRGLIRDQEQRFDRGSDPGPTFDPEGTGRFKGRKR